VVLATVAVGLGLWKEAISVTDLLNLSDQYPEFRSEPQAELCSECMSALGHKQTCAPQKAMSALHPIATAKADRCSAKQNVRLGPKADIRVGYARFEINAMCAAKLP
jgi:hypothetical protein